MTDGLYKPDNIYDPDEIVNSLLNYYYAVYILDYINDLVIPLRLPKDATQLTGCENTQAMKSLSWSQTLGKALEKAVPENYYKSMYAFLNRDNVSTAFDVDKESRVAKYTFQQTTGDWKRAILTPLKMNGSITERALLAIVNADMQQTNKDETNAMKLQAKRYQDVFCGAVEQMYTGMIRVDIQTGQAIQLRSEGNHMIEYPHNKKWDELCRIALSMVHPEDKDIFYNNCSMETWEQVDHNKKFHFKFRDSYGQKDGAYRWYSGAVHIVCEKEQKFALLYTVDITDQVMERVQLQESSERDEQTFLYNRTHLDIMLETEYQDIRSCGVLFLDINDLKETNDLKGHKAGDELIYQGAESLRILQSDEIHVYRYGGDEFLVIAPNITQEYLDTLIEQWRTHLKHLEELNGIACSMAYGKAWSIAPCSVKELIAMADAEMYKHKKQIKREQSEDSSLEKHDLFRQHRYFQEVLATEYDCIYELDIRNDHYHCVKALFSDTKDYTPTEGSFSPYLIHVLAGKVDEEDLKEVLSAISASNIMKQMDDKRILRLQLKPSYVEGIVWNIKVQVVEMKNDYPIKVMILLKVESTSDN